MEYMERHPMIMIVIGIMGISLCGYFCKIFSGSVGSDGGLPSAVDGYSYVAGCVGL